MCKLFHLLELTYSIDKYPSLPFTVIINPESGPGINTLLDQNYERELPKLNSRKNVKTIGYVRTTWATRNISDVLQDVSTYSSWAENKTADYKVHGIFYDEVPNAYSSDTTTYMSTLDQYAKSQSGFGGINYVSSTPVDLTDFRSFIIREPFQMIIACSPVLISLLYLKTIMGLSLQTLQIRS